MRLAPKSYVVKGNLSATLECIRSANKQSIIRFYDISRISTGKSQIPASINSKQFRFANVCSSCLRKQRPTSKRFSRKGYTSLLRSKVNEEALSLITTKTDETRRRYRSRPIILKPLAEKGARGLTYLFRKGQTNSQIVNINEHDGKLAIRYPSLLTANKTLNDDRYMKYVSGAQE